MDALKSIPSGFFDAIARIVPGFVAIVLALIVSDYTWKQITDSIFGEGVIADDKSFAFLVILFFASYVVGQLIAPFAKLVQRIGELKWLGAAPKAPKRAYDYLRIHYPFAGAQCAKIRAEFTMFNSLAVVFTVAAVCYAAMFPCPSKTLGLMIVLLISTAVRGRTVRDTFNDTVEKFVQATPFPDRPNNRLQSDA